MIKFFKRGESEQSDQDTFAEIEIAEKRLEGELTDATARNARAVDEANRCRSRLSDIHPAVLRDALLEEQEAAAAFSTVQSRYESEMAELRGRREKIRAREEEAAIAARMAAYEQARAAYIAQCQALVEPALKLRKLASAAGIVLPSRTPPYQVDLLFDTLSEPHVAGTFLEIWRMDRP
ncbi:hypothetical protein [Paraburkholderia pallida]|uniref:Uncharacterized protein n=1 Tax=Paraburkholderia pallida TaxID=2547399 RepID=A0A4P7CPY4_9BURK|nr:hypothetical protein [Paraburkholderia pallida]QBQ97905.1 hypothetical protein E1956_12440 [Paraburkholderia pallida]